MKKKQLIKIFVFSSVCYVYESWTMSTEDRESKTVLRYVMLQMNVKDKLGGENDYYSGAEMSGGKIHVIKAVSY